jgi:hypothetical protein
VREPSLRVKKKRRLTRGRRRSGRSRRRPKKNAPARGRGVPVE